MVRCNCGREFNSLNGFHAHMFYCDYYLNSLSPEEQEKLLERRKLQKQKKAEKQEQRESTLVYVESNCPICGKIVKNRADQNSMYWNTYCSKSCSGKAKWNNLSEEEKSRISKLSCKANKHKWQRIKSNKINKFISERHYCEQCGKLITTLFGSGRFCSKQCSDNYCREFNKLHRDEASKRAKAYWQNPEIRAKMLQARRRSILEGRWPKMMHSCEPSYPEKFWMSVLERANISFKYNYLVKHSDIGVVANKLTWYKLDFYLEEYNIDLEIDGSQHYQSKKCIEHDKLRDARLSTGGYTVYRIPWIGEHAVNEQLAKLESFIISIDDAKADKLGIEKITEEEFRAKFNL